MDQSEPRIEHRCCGPFAINEDGSKTRVPLRPTEPEEEHMPAAFPVTMVGDREGEGGGTDQSAASGSASDAAAYAGAAPAE